MISKLKRRFIILAMAALAILLAVIVAGMNIINYEKVVSDADERIEVIEENYDRFLNVPGGSFMPQGDVIEQDDMDDDEDFDHDDMFDREDEPFFGRGGEKGPFMTRDSLLRQRARMARYSRSTSTGSHLSMRERPDPTRRRRYLPARMKASSGSSGTRSKTTDRACA